MQTTFLLKPVYVMFCLKRRLAKCCFGKIAIINFISNSNIRNGIRETKRISDILQSFKTRTIFLSYSLIVYEFGMEGNKAVRAYIKSSSSKRRLAIRYHLS